MKRHPEGIRTKRKGGVKMKRRLLSIKAPRLSISELRFWWPALVIIILLCLMIILRHPYIQECAIVALVFVTFMYVVFTKRILDETRQQRLDASRPLLVPVGGREGVARLAEMPSLDNESGWLHVSNIGAGPAVNIAVRLELRPEKGSSTIQLDEMLTTVEPLASGDKGLVRQWSSAEKPFGIYDDHWIVISYNDLFHRHFETEARRIQESDSWVSIKTMYVKQPRPRVREVNYYATLNGSG